MVGDPFDMDERVKNYLKSRGQRADPDSPEYKYGIGAIEQGGLQGIARGMAQMGSVHGKTPSAEPFVESSKQGMVGMESLAKLPDIDPQVMKYILDRTKPVSTGNKTTIFQKGPPTPEGYATTFDPGTGTYKQTTQKVKVPPPPQAAMPKPPAQPKGMTEGEMGRFDNVRMGLTALDDAEKALNEGDWTFTLIGDNKYTEAARRFSEALGRMQSGGAIQKEEEEKFKAMLPTSRDSQKMQKYKIKKAREEFAARYDTLKSSGKNVPIINQNATTPAPPPSGAKAVKSYKDLP